MTEYSPDMYELLKISDEEDTYYRVFSTWVGSYTTGDRWRMNSCVKSVEELDDEVISFIGYSGSRYNIRKDYIGTTMFTGSVLDNYIKQCKEEGVLVEIVSYDDVKGELHES